MLVIAIIIVKNIENLIRSQSAWLSGVLHDQQIALIHHTQRSQKSWKSCRLLRSTPESELPVHYLKQGETSQQMFWIMAVCQRYHLLCLGTCTHVYRSPSWVPRPAPWWKWCLKMQLLRRIFFHWELSVTKTQLWADKPAWSPGYSV